MATKGAARRDGLSQPRHDVVIEKDVEIAMRDGARLRADVFRPKSNARFPVIINLGIVNVVVGFAPLKPAEFVILKIQQLAGQIQT